MNCPFCMAPEARTETIPQAPTWRRSEQGGRWISPYPRLFTAPPPASGTPTGMPVCGRHYWVAVAASGQPRPRSGRVPRSQAGAAKIERGSPVAPPPLPLCLSGVRKQSAAFPMLERHGRASCTVGAGHQPRGSLHAFARPASPLRSWPASRLAGRFSGAR